VEGRLEDRPIQINPFKSKVVESVSKLEIYSVYSTMTRGLSKMEASETIRFIISSL
jgi:hypothetical protein